MCVRSVVMFLVLCCAMAIFAGVEGKPGHYTPTWAVHIEGGRQMADMVAAEHGFINLGEIIGDFYHFHHNSVKRRSISPSLHHHGKLHSDDRVRWVRQQRILSRKKRDFLPLVDPTASSAATSPVRNTLLPEVTKLSHPDSSERSDRDLIQSARPGRTPMPVVFDTTKFPLNDHRWPQMWYLNRGGGLDMNVIPAWKEGVTGRGIVVTILDDGLEKDHPDLLVNYDPQASYDVNNHDEDPMPRYDMLDSNRHGTRCAGEVAATANNTLCAVGVAFGASVGGVRMLDGDVTDAVEARSLSLNPQHIDIYSASWGPDDDGKTVDGPGELATRAFIEGVTKGRSGKGSIFIWASGNGGRDHDNCNCDGYTNSIWTLSISSATEKGEVPWYSEMCSSTLATTYSSGSMNEKQVVTTDLHHSCTNSHTGTSASAPLAAGICALALEVNRDLTWRDMQHIVVRTAKPANLQASGWRTNGVGRNVSHSFGYGLMDAAAMVQLARTWRTVPAQHRCEVSAPHNDKLIPAKSQVVLQLAVNQCVGVNYLEHVQAKISLTAARRGDLQINLTSPAGTRVTLLATRSHDMSRAGFNSWPFMTVHTWGESPYGIWLLEIHNEGRYMAEISQWDMVFYGTDVPAQETDFPVKPKIDAIDSAGELSIGEGEAGQHNSLEEEKVVGKWRDSQRVRDDGRVELQPETPVNTAEDASASGCLSFVSSQTPPHCLECHQDFYLFSGQCYASCPVKTFATHTFSTQPSLPKPKEIVEVPGSIEASVSSSLRRRRTPKKNNRKSLQDTISYTYSNSKIKRNIPGVSSNVPIVSRNIMLPQPPKICMECHYSCLTCSGPYNYQCLTCPVDAKIYNATGGVGNIIESYCYPSQLMPQLESATWIYRLYLIFFIILFLFASVIVYFLLTWVIQKFGFSNCCRSEDELAAVSYNRLGHVDEYTDGSKNISKEIHGAIFNHSDSESEG